MNAIAIDNAHYFWVLPDEDVVQELENVVKRLGHVTLVVGWNVYTQIRHKYQDQIAWREAPDIDCLDIFVLRTTQGKVKIAVTR